MATTYEWNCKTVDVHPAEGDYTNVVYNVHWILTGVSEEVDGEGNPYTATSIGTQVLDTSEITDFIPVEELTNEEITSWTKVAMGEEQVSALETSVQEAINSLITPTSITITIGK